MSIVLDLNKSAGVLDLNKASPNFNKLRGVLNWEPSPVHTQSLSQGFDLDIFAYVLNGSGKLSSGSDVVYYGNKFYVNNAVSVPTDNRTGEGDDDESIDLELSKLPADKTEVAVFVFIYQGQQRGQSFGMIPNSSFVLNCVEKNQEIAKYNLQQYTNETAIHIGSFKRSGAGWEFAPSGDVASADPNQVAQAYV